MTFPAPSKPTNWTPLLCAAEVKFEKDAWDFEAKLDNMTQICWNVIGCMATKTLYATTPSGSNVLHVLASRGYCQAIDFLLTALSEVQVPADAPDSMQDVIGLLLNDKSAKGCSVADLAARSCRHTALFLVRKWHADATRPFPWETADSVQQEQEQQQEGWPGRATQPQRRDRAGRRGNHHRGRGGAAAAKAASNIPYNFVPRQPQLGPQPAFNPRARHHV